MTAVVRTSSSTKEHEDTRNIFLEFLRERSILAEFIQVVKYALVGVSNTLIDAAFYFALTRWLWLGSLPVLAKGVAYAIGMTNSFYWNRNWTFKSQSSPWKAAFLFTLTHIAALGINAMVMGLSLTLFHTPELVALVLATGSAFGWNFVLNKVVVFRA